MQRHVRSFSGILDHLGSATVSRGGQKFWQKFSPYPRNAESPRRYAGMTLQRLSEHRDRDDTAAGCNGDGSVVELDPFAHAATRRIDPHQGLIAVVRHPDTVGGRDNVLRLRADIDPP